MRMPQRTRVQSLVPHPHTHTAELSVAIHSIHAIINQPRDEDASENEGPVANAANDSIRFTINVKRPPRSGGELTRPPTALA